jgi:hypothetical protein
MMQRALTLLAFALVAAVMGCAKSSGQGSSGLVGLSASEAICRVAKDGLSYRIDSGPVVTPTKAIACQRVDGPQPHIIGATREKKLVVFRASCPATVGCLSPQSRSSSAPAAQSPAH